FGEWRLVLRCADDGDGQRYAQRRRDDPQTDTDLQPHSSGDDHQRADRDHLRRRGGVKTRKLVSRCNNKDHPWPIQLGTLPTSSAPSSTCISRSIYRPSSMRARPRIRVTVSYSKSRSISASRPCELSQWTRPRASCVGKRSSIPASRSRYQSATAL